MTYNLWIWVCVEAVSDAQGNPQGVTAARKTGKHACFSGEEVTQLCVSFLSPFLTHTGEANLSDLYLFCLDFNIQHRNIGPTGAFTFSIFFFFLYLNCLKF